MVDIFRSYWTWFGIAILLLLSQGLVIAEKFWLRVCIHSLMHALHLLRPLMT
jgi:hypothetical protein